MWGVAIVSLCVLLALGGMILVRRRVPAWVRQQSTAGAGVIYAALHVMYGVLLAFSLFLTWQQFAAAQNTVRSEASKVEELYWLAEAFPPPQRDPIQDAAMSYARVVVEKEWPLTGRGPDSRPSQEAERLAAELRRGVDDLNSGAGGNQALVAEGASLNTDLQEIRVMRLLESREGIPSILWAVMVIGGVITVAFTFVLGIKEAWLHGASVAALTVVIVLVIYAIYRIDYPFTGDLRVRPEAFELVIERMERDDVGRR